MLEPLLEPLLELVLLPLLDVLEPLELVLLPPELPLPLESVGAGWEAASKI